MKVRILGNSLRFRLRQPQVAQFETSGSIRQTTEFGIPPADALTFSLEITKAKELTVEFEANTVTVGVPEHLAATWVTTDQVGFGGKIDTGKGKVIEVLVEKDFVCLDAPEEENIGAYPNPNAVC